MQFDYNRIAEIIALSRLCGVTGTKDEIFKRFYDLYLEALNEKGEGAGESKAVELFNSPF